MSVAVLIITSLEGFGELLKECLDETGRFQAYLASGETEALEIANTSPIDLCILDSDLEGVFFAHFIQNLKKELPNARYILVPPEGISTQISLDGWKPDGYLAKPFYLPDLVSTLDRVLEPQEQSECEQPDLYEHLVTVVQASLARFGLVLKNGDLCTYTDDISKTTAWGLSQLFHDLKPLHTKAKNTGFTRLVHIEELADEYLVFAMPLDETGVLVLGFEVNLPFSQVRRQSNSLVRALAPYFKSKNIFDTVQLYTDTSSGPFNHVT